MGTAKPMRSRGRYGPRREPDECRSKGGSSMCRIPRRRPVEDHETRRRNLEERSTGLLQSESGTDADADDPTMGHESDAPRREERRPAVQRRKDPKG